MGPTEQLAHFIVETDYEQLPQEAINNAKQAILDCLGVTLVGCDTTGSKVITEYVKEELSRPEAGVIGSGFKTVAPQAAWVNGAMAHALDYDDWSTTFIGHPSVVILPAVLALGDKYQLSGKEILLSYILGFEVGSRIGPVCIPQYLLGWHTTPTVGTIGAVAAAAKALRLGIEETRMAFGIAASLAGGLKQNFGTMTKPLHAGNAARNGVMSAMLAQKGFTAHNSILEADQGFFKVLGGGAQIDETKIVQDIGKRFDIISPGLVLKAYPSCGGTHTSIEAALHLRKRHAIKVEELDEIEIKVSSALATAVIYTNPQTGLEGKFSYEYCVAIALLYGQVGLNHFTDEQVRQPVVQEIMSKIKRIHPPDMPLEDVGSEITIRMKDGTTFSHKIDTPKGDQRNPMTWDEVCSKYRNCASMVLPDSEIEASLELTSKLEFLENISQLMDILTFKLK